MSQSRLNLLVLRSRDLERASQFYWAVGLTFVRERHGRGEEHLACERAGTVIEIYPVGDGARPDTATRIGFQVASVDETVSKLRQIGSVVQIEPKPSPWGLRAVVCDPDGRHVELTEPVEPAITAAPPS